MVEDPSSRAQTPSTPALRDDPTTDASDPAGPSAPRGIGAFRAVLTVGGLQFLLALLFVARSKTIAVMLGPSGVGVVSVVDQLVQLVTQLSALALSIAPTKFLSRTLHQGPEAVSRIYQALFKTLLGSVAAGTTLSLLIVAIRTEWLGSALTGYRTLFLIAILSAPALVFNIFFANVLASTKGYRSSLHYLLLSALGMWVAAFLGIHWGGLPGLYYGNLVVGGAGTLGVLVYVRAGLQLEAHTRGFQLREEFRRHPDLLAYCAVVYVLSFAQPFSFFIVRSVLLSYRGAMETGYFQAAFATAGAISMLLTQSIRVYFEPIVNRALPVAEKTRHANDFLHTFGVLILVGALPLMLFPGEALRILFTADFTHAAPVLFLFVLSECVFLCAQVYVTLILGADDLRGFFAANLAGHVSLAGLVWLFAPREGLWGVAWAFLLSRLILLTLATVRLVQRHGLRIPSRLIGLLTYVAGTLCLAGLLNRGETPLTLLTLSGRLAIFLTLASSAWLFLGRDEKSWVARQLASVGPRTLMDWAGPAFRALVL